MIESSHWLPSTISSPSRLCGRDPAQHVRPLIIISSLDLLQTKFLWRVEWFMYDWRGLLCRAMSLYGKYILLSSLRMLKWIARLSRIAMWLSLARIYPERHRARRISFNLAGLCTLLAISTALLAAYGCPDSAGGTHQRVDKCYSAEGGKRTAYQNITLSISIGWYSILISCSSFVR